MEEPSNDASASVQWTPTPSSPPAVEFRSGSLRAAIVVSLLAVLAVIHAIAAWHAYNAGPLGDALSAGSASGFRGA